MDIVGRYKEISVLNDALSSKKAELIAVYGRRRIGKTFLVRQIYERSIRLEWTGIYKASLKEQLLNFYLQLNTDKDIPKSWIEAFHLLGKQMDTWKGKQKKVLFIDEFPWLDSRKSRFLPAFENFWNSYASKRNDLVVVICGSAASYMIQKVVRSKGGLHNRLTRKIHLPPFELSEFAKMLTQKKVMLSKYDQLLLYMVLGGVPYYLEYVQPGKSVAQIVDQLCFQKEGFLHQEFPNIFVSLFDQHENHEAVVRVLANSRKGLTRSIISEKTSISSGGALSKVLDELEQSGFVQHYIPFKGSKNGLFRLTDEYARFYLRFIEKSKAVSWQTLQPKAAFKAWAGFSFETICIKHVKQILSALKIAGVHSEIGNWVSTKTDPAVQIDLVIDRNDHVINLCEVKFSEGQFTITKKYAAELRNKRSSFIQETNSNKSVFNTIITTHGVAKNIHSLEQIQEELTMDVLFETL